MIVFPDAVLWACTYLRTALPGAGYTGVRVADRYRGDDLEVWVQRDGGPQLDVVREAPLLRINVFAEGATSGPVSDLAATVSALMRQAADGNPVCHVRQTLGPSEIEDVIPRRLMLFELITRGGES